jgi:hypothetical protein
VVQLGHVGHVDQQDGELGERVHTDLVEREAGTVRTASVSTSAPDSLAISIDIGEPP